MPSQDAPKWADLSEDILASAFASDTQTERQAKKEVRTTLADDLQAVLRRLSAIESSLSRDARHVEDDEAREVLSRLQDDVVGAVSSLEELTDAAHGIVSDYAELDGDFDERGSMIEDLARRMASSEEVRAHIYASGDADMVRALLRRHREADWVQVARSQMARGAPEIAMQVLLDPRRPSEPAPRDLWNDAILGAASRDPSLVYRLLREWAFPEEAGIDERHWRAVFDGMSVANPESALLMLSLPKVSGWVNATPEDWGVAFNNLAVRSPRSAAQRLKNAKLPDGVTIRPDAWVNLFRWHIQLGPAAALAFVDVYPAPEGVRLQNEDLADLLASEELTSFDRVKLMPLVAHIEGARAEEMFIHEHQGQAPPAHPRR